MFLIIYASFNLQPGHLFVYSQLFHLRRRKEFAMTLRPFPKLILSGRGRCTLANSGNLLLEGNVIELIEI